MTSSTPQGPPKALLFDIGGVCVVSPFQAILDYEKAQGIPLGWVNYAISKSAPGGAWQRAERGEIPLDDAFFAQFARDLADPALWPDYWRRDREKGGGLKSDDAPPPPKIDAKALFWEMMRTSRTPDPWMYPALLKLGEAARQRRDAGRADAFVIGALSNTIIFPDGIMDERGEIFDTGLRDAKSPRVAGGHVRDAFDVFVSSAHVGLRKPDPEVYRMAVKLMDEEARKRGVEGGVRMEDVVFLDDIGMNLRAARQLGMRTIKVELGKSWKAVKELEEVVGLRLLDEDAKARL